MREPTKEWLMVCDLMLLGSRPTKRQVEFIYNLYEHLDPHEPFLSQQSPKQLKWLNFIHSKYVHNIREW